MFSTARTECPQRISFLLVPEFSMMAFASAIEPLRIANRLSGRRLFEWDIIAEQPGPVTASNGLPVMAPKGISEVDAASSLIVTAGFRPQLRETPAILGWLRRLERHGAALGALDTGCHLLAMAGLLDGYRITMHWEAIPAFREEFPEIRVVQSIFEVDRNRFTCAGGTAAIDMMLLMISRRHDHALAIGVSEQLILGQLRHHDDAQRLDLVARLGIHNMRLRKIVDTMERNLEYPLSPDTLATTAGISRRQIERLFKSHLDTSPSDFYVRLRLERARQLLQQTEMSVTDIAVACGFDSAPYFSRCYRTRFGIAPRDDRHVYGVVKQRPGALLRFGGRHA